MASILIRGGQSNKELRLQPNTSHAGDPGDAKLQPGDPRRSVCLNLPMDPILGRLTCLDVPWDLISRRLTCLNLLGNLPVRGPRRSTCFDLPREPILRRLTCLDLSGDSISRRLSCLSLPGDLLLDLGMPGSQVSTVLGRISLKKTHPSKRKSTQGN